mgnify:CR=1 FL=1
MKKFFNLYIASMIFYICLQIIMLIIYPCLIISGSSIKIAIGYILIIFNIIIIFSLLFYYYKKNF